MHILIDDQMRQSIVVTHENNYSRVEWLGYRREVCVYKDIKQVCHSVDGDYYNEACKYVTGHN